MGYDLLWFACTMATCDPSAVHESIACEQHQMSLDILEKSGVAIEGIPKMAQTPPNSSSEDLLQKIDSDKMRKAISASIPNGWSITHDTKSETALNSDGGAVQISWNDRYAIGTGYGNFEGGLKAVQEALAGLGFICFDPQIGQTYP